MKKSLKKSIRKAHEWYLKIRLDAGEGAWLLSNSFIEDYRMRRKPVYKIMSIHRKGFTVIDWEAMELESHDYKTYISSAQYCGMHPLNGQYSSWIDDKLTLKYLCAGTKLDKYMPEYYYLIDEKGEVLPLMDTIGDERSKGNKNILLMLERKGMLALKMIAGSIGLGFYRAEYSNGKYLLNGKVKTYEEMMVEIGGLRNYLVTEYLRPHQELVKFSAGTVNCLRYLVGRVDGKFILIKSYIRFGTKASGYVENYGVGGVLCYVDNAGEFKKGNILKEGKNVIIEKHPDNETELKGKIPLWNEIQEAVSEFEIYFPQLDYLGFDFVVTNENKVKILEINSLTSLDALQLYGSLTKTSANAFYKKYLR